MLSWVCIFESRQAMQSKSKQTITIVNSFVQLQDPAACLHVKLLQFVLVLHYYSALCLLIKYAKSKKARACVKGHKTV